MFDRTGLDGFFKSTLVKGERGNGVGKEVEVEWSGSGSESGSTASWILACSIEPALTDFKRAPSFLAVSLDCTRGCKRSVTLSLGGEVSVMLVQVWMVVILLKKFHV